MPGAGKTYYAKLLSEQYGHDYIDLDEYIEHKEGRTIAEVFKTDGEQYFRQVETECLNTVINEAEDKTVFVACGGGTPVYNNNMSLMKEHGCVIYLDVDTGLLAERIKGSVDTRPLFAAAGNKDEVLNNLHQQRKVWYEQAHYTLKTSEITLNNFNNIITLCTGRQ